MPIRPPALDDRRYEDLVAELVARIPAHTPEWTHPRPGDPGRTLIELFAWFGDAMLYRANLVPERQRLVFLTLLGADLHPAIPARGMVSVSLREDEPPHAVHVQPLASLSGPVSFEAKNEFTVHPVTVAAYYKRPASDDEVGIEVRQALSDFHANGSAIRPYVTTPIFVDGKPSETGIDIVTETTDRCLWLALLASRAPNGVAQADFNDQVRAALGQNPNGSRQILNLGVIPTLPTVDPLEPVTERARVPHLWEITANTTNQLVTRTRPWRPEYLPLDRLAGGNNDTTNGLTRAGVLRVAVPRPAIIHGPTNNVRDDDQAGVGDRPPRIDDPAIADRIVAWIRLRPQPARPAPRANEVQFSGRDSRFEQTPVNVAPERQVEHLRISWAGINVIEIEQLTTRTNIIVGESNGNPDQQIQLPATSIESDTLRLEVEEETGWVGWTRVDDLGSLTRDPEQSRDARAFELDAEAGVAKCGDGLRGRVPGIGRRIRVAFMRHGGGSIGNLPPGTLKTITATQLDGTPAGSSLVVSQTLPLTGGIDAESIQAAEQRIPSRFRHRERAITSDDYKTLAFETPGVAVGRVEMLPRFKPQQRFSNIPGVVTVMTLPGRPFAPAPNPRADRPFLEAIHAHLDTRRPLGTELYVIGCEYIPVAVSVAVSIRDGAETDTTLEFAKQALRRALWPLPGGGFDGQGWPLGRALSNRELAVEVARVPGVSEVNGINLFRRNPANQQWVALGNSRDGREQNMNLQRWQLPELLAVVAVSGDATPLDVANNNPFADPNGVGVPVVPDLC